MCIEMRWASLKGDTVQSAEDENVPVQRALHSHEVFAILTFRNELCTPARTGHNAGGMVVAKKTNSVVVNTYREGKERPSSCQRMRSQQILRTYFMFIKCE